MVLATREESENTGYNGKLSGSYLTILDPSIPLPLSSTTYFRLQRYLYHDHRWPVSQPHQNTNTLYQVFHVNEVIYNVYTKASPHVLRIELLLQIIPLGPVSSFLALTYTSHKFFEYSSKATLRSFALQQPWQIQSASRHLRCWLLLRYV